MKNEMRVLIAVHLLSVTIAITKIYGQSPNWIVEKGKFQYGMSLVVFLSMDHTPLNSANDKVVAMAGNEVRGVASPVYVDIAKRYLTFLQVFGNREGEAISFKLYNSSTGKDIDVGKTIPFKIDAQIGNTFQALSIASPALSNEANLKEFSLLNVNTIARSIEGSEVNLIIECPMDSSIFIPQFQLSNGARIFKNRQLIESAMTKEDFSQPVTYSVLSEDESVLKNYTIHLTKQESAYSGFNSSNVITPNKDGLNDFWIVKDIFKYQQHKFQIVDINGRVVYESVGYQNDWDGTYKGDRLDMGKYYFIISTPDTNQSITGEILLIY